MKLNIISNFPGYLIGTLLVLQYFNSNSEILDTGFNHTLVLQCLTCILSIPFLYALNIKKSLYIVGIVFLFLIFIAIHYEVVSRINDYTFALNHIWSYVKFCFYLFIFLVVYLYFDGEDFIVFIRFLKYIFWALLIEGLIYLIFKILGFSIVHLFESAQGRFASIFLHHNSLVNLFAFYVISYVMFFGSHREKVIYLLLGVILIILSQERSAIIGLLFLGFSYVFFSYDEQVGAYKNKIFLLFTFSSIVVGLVVIYTLNFRAAEYTSFGMFLRTILLRIYLSYLAIVHLFESGNPIFGFGPFMSILPINLADMHSDYVEKFVHVVSVILGNTEEIFFRQFHDVARISSPSYTVNAHNTFVILLYHFGFLSLFILFYFGYLFFISINYIKQHLKEILLIEKSQAGLYTNENFFQISSLVFIIVSLPILFFLSFDNYLILNVIAFGHIGSLVRKVAHG